MVLVHLHVHDAYVHVHTAYPCVLMPDCPASDQSGTGMKKTNDVEIGPVSNQADVVRHFFGPVWD
jgi:hypothetical protein